MKKFTKNLTLVFVCVLVCCMAVTALVACDIIQSHAHNYSIQKSDGDNHWNECSCGARDESSITAHDYNIANKDDTHHWNECSCGAIDEKVEHSYSTAKSDATHHWNECSCGTKDESSITAHSYSNAKKNDTHHWNECSCGAIDEKVEHSYSTAKSDATHHWNECSCGAIDQKAEHSYTIWKHDETNHWKECSCGAKDSTSTAAHYDAGNDGTCDICDYDEMHVHYYEITDVVSPDFDYKYEGWDIVGVEPIDGSAHLTCEDCIDENIALKFLQFDETIEATVEPNEAVYYYLYVDYYYLQKMPEKAVITIGDTTVLEMSMGAYIDASYQKIWVSLGNKFADGATEEMLNDGEAYSAIIFKAYATDGNISFKLSGTPGTSQGSAIEIEKNKEYNGTASSNALWLKYVPSASEKLVLINNCGEWIDLAINDSYLYGQYGIYDMVSGQNYYICISGTGEYSIKLVDIDDSYRGLSKDYPVIVEGSSIEVTSNASGVKYYEFTAPDKCTYEVTVAPGIDYSLYVYNATTGYWGFKWDEEFNKGDKFVIEVSNYSEEITSYTVSVNFIIPQAKDHTFTITDASGNPLSNVTVTIETGADTEPTGTTDSNGTVTINFLQGAYAISLSGYDTESYSYTTQYTSMNTESYTLTLKTPVSKKFIVKAGSTPLADVTITLTDAWDSTIGTATTDANGCATIKYFAPEQGRIFVALSGLSDDQSFTTVRYYPSDLDDLTLSVITKVAHTITIEAPAGETLELGGITVGLYDYNDNLVASGITNDSGIATIKAVENSFGYTIKLSDIPFGYSENGGSTEGETAVTVTLQKLPTLALGNNNVDVNFDSDVWSWGTTEYLFGSTEGGSYILTFTDTEGGLYVYTKSEYSPILSAEDGYLQYKFKLAAGESISIKVTSINDESTDDTISYVLTIAVDENPDPTPVTELVEGENYVTGTFMGNTISFTAEHAGTYIISSTDSEFCILDSSYNIIADADIPYEIEMTAGQTIELVFSTTISMSSANYYVTVTYDNGAK